MPFSFRVKSAHERPDLPSMAVLGRLCEAAERVMRDHLNPLKLLTPCLIALKTISIQ
jgi:hypothetical protein